MSHIETASILDSSISISGTTVPLGNNLSNAITRNLQPGKGKLSYNRTDDLLYFGNGTAWVPASAGIIVPVNPIANVYISTTGNDALEGLTTLTAVLTLSRALEVVFNHGWNETVAINFLPGNYELPGGESYNFRSTAQGSNSQIMIMRSTSQTIASAETVITANTVDVQPTGLVTIIVAGPIGVNGHAGDVVEFTSGSLTGTRYQISSNTANSLIILSSILPGVGDTFNILTNNVTITVADGTANVFQNGFLVMQNMNVSLGSGSVMQYLSVKVVPDNLKFVGSGVINIFDTSIIFSAFISQLFTDFGSQNLGMAIVGTFPDVIAVQLTGVFMVMNQLVMRRVYFNAVTSNVILDKGEIADSPNFSVSAGQISSQNLFFQDCTNDGVIGVSGAGSFFSNTRIQNFSGGSIFNVSESGRLGLNNAIIDVAGGWMNCNSGSVSMNNVTITNITGNSSNFSTSAVYFGNVSYTGTSGINFNGCLVNSHDIFANGISDNNGINFYLTNWNESGTITMNGCTGNPCINLNSSRVSVNTLLIRASDCISINNTVASINNLYLESFVGGNNNTIRMSSVEINHTSMDGVLLEQTDKRWNISASRVFLNDWGHSGAITNSFFDLSVDSSLNLTSSQFYNIRHILITSSRGSTATLDSVIVEDCSCVVDASSSKCVVLTNVNNNNILTNPMGAIVSVRGGDFTITGCNLTRAPTEVLNLVRVKCFSSNNFFENDGTDSVILGNLVTLRSTSDSLISVLGSGIILNTSTFSIENPTINTFNVGLSFFRTSNGYLEGATGLVSGAVAVNLRSGSSFSNGGSNTIAGTPLGDDVQVGQVSPQPWGALAITNDFGYPTPDYVTVTPP